MQIIKTIKAYRQQQRNSSVVGFVPTMGALHAGHAELIKQCRLLCDQLVVSIFVNPLQFSPNEDFTQYPRTVEADLELLKTLKVDIAFIPDSQEIYPNCDGFNVSETKLSQLYEGCIRPGFFQGVTNVVARLFNIIQPQHAYFGQKDLQQYKIIEQMIDDLHFPIQLHMHPIVREADGLAMSSRNRYLSPTERQQAPQLHQILSSLDDQYRQGVRQAQQLVDFGKKMITTKPFFKLQYLEVVDMHNLEPITQISHQPHSACILIAAALGSTRLIDNWILT